MQASVALGLTSTSYSHFQAQNVSENNLVSFPVLSQIKPQAPVVSHRLDPGDRSYLKLLAVHPHLICGPDADVGLRVEPLSRLSSHHGGVASGLLTS